MVNLSALTAEALGRSDVLWVRGAGAERATWFATGPVDSPLADHVLVVSGGPELDLSPVLGDGTAPAPQESEIVLRSKGDGGRLLTLHVRATALGPTSAEWETAAEALRAERLNAGPDITDAWRARSTVWALLPFGAPEQAPGRPGPATRVDASGELGVAASPVRRPWHLGSRGDARRARRPQT